MPIIYLFISYCNLAIHFVVGGFGGGADFVIYDETAANKKTEEGENREDEMEDKENMYASEISCCNYTTCYHFFKSFPSILLNTVFSRLDVGGVYLKLDLVDSAFI